MGRLQQREREFYLGWDFLTSLGTVLRLLYPRLDYAALLTLTSIVCAGGYEVATYNTGTIIGKFYNALLSKDEHYFWNLFWKATLIYMGQSLLLATTSFSTWLLYLAIRRNLVTALHQMYYRRNAYYILNSVDNAGIDNPYVVRILQSRDISILLSKNGFIKGSIFFRDQRITQDAERMCSTLAKSIFPYILISPGVIAWYTYRTWATSVLLSIFLAFCVSIVQVIQPISSKEPSTYAENISEAFVMLF
ncbi:hypothetical protein OESDEN_08832 [Oesophagostomum dentatum]|uniref:ABC transmembrane type-1 domain-containing protein n=1 Tax=Oesophagostomum dentatum TaxID=61180 RepID=A0A0B1T680_OESDE|nr:hypothetical protein OESDEN_08832 [Oesophagostomum dentatum]